MNESGWSWADLRGEQLEMVREAEETLGSGVDYVLVYQPDQDGGARPPQRAVQVARLDEGRWSACKGWRRTWRAWRWPTRRAGRRIGRGATLA